MASGDSLTTLESYLNQATNPNNEEERWDSIQGFYLLVNQETEGPQIALRLLAHKIQSPQEKEALQALTVLEACMNNCGKRFHSEAAKFRFLNELIKILSPKYFGGLTPEKVKERVTAVLYGWTLWLKDEPKIQEAYSMLKKQGIVKKDPKAPDTVIMPPLPRRLSDSVFDQEDKAQLLSRLLKSGRPEDLETANRLIKNTFKEEQEKAEKVSKRESTLKEVERSTRQLRELLDQYSRTGTSAQFSEEGKELYERCDRLRPSLFRLASDTVDDDASLAQILAANDELTLVVNAYKKQAGEGVWNGTRTRCKSDETKSEEIAPTSPRGIKSYHLIDLSALDSPKTHRKADSPPAFKQSSPAFFCNSENSFQTKDLKGLELPSEQTQDNSKSYYDELMQLNGDIQMTNTDQNGGRGPLLRARGCGESKATSNGLDIWPVPQNHQFQELGSSSKSQGEHEVFGSPETLDKSSYPPQILKNIFVPMETIKSSHLEPITFYNHGGIHASLHFACNSPPGHPDVAMVIMSAVNTSSLQVTDLHFQAAVPKSMFVKLQPPSGTLLPPYNPLLPPHVVSQVILLANPQRGNVRLRFKLTLTHGDEQLNKTGETSSFPEWNSLIGYAN